MRNNSNLTNKILQVITIIFLMFFSGIINVSAEEMEGAKVIIENANAVIDNEVEVVIGVTNGSGIGAYELNIMYDNNALEFVKGETIIQSLAYEARDNGSSIYITGVLASDINNGSYVELMKLTFKVKETTAEGIYSLYIVEGMMVNGQTGEGILFDISDGEVNVSEKLIGDVDENRKINVADATLVFRYVAGKNVESNAMIKRNGDVNRDGKVDIIDAMMLFHYVTDRIDAFVQSNDSDVENEETISTETIQGEVGGENQQETVNKEEQTTGNDSINNESTTENKPISKPEQTTDNKSEDRPQQKPEETTINKQPTIEETIKKPENTTEKETIKNDKPTSDKENIIEVIGISLDKTDASLNKGAMLVLRATVNPTNASDKTVTWSTSDASVATVNGNGRVTAVGNGTAVITVKTNDGSKAATCTVTVITSVTLVELDNTTLVLNKDDSASLIATVKPEGASDKSVVWSSSDTNVATVDSRGKVKAVGNGTAVITVETVDGGKTATCKVTVTTPVTGVSLDKANTSLKVDEKATLIATVNPSTASNKKVIWSSSNTAVVTVDSTGKITAIGNGTATITVKTVDGGKTATCKVTVTTSVKSVSLNKTSVSLDKGKTLSLVATVNPSTASNKSVKWSSSDKTVATVDSNGKITAVKAGTATITVKTVDGGKTATCKVTVKPTVSGVTLNKTSITLEKGRGVKLTATVSPAGVANKSVKWSSSNTSVATVDSNGNVIAVGNGTATITVKTADGGKTATCKVTVKTMVSSVDILPRMLELEKGKTCTLTTWITPSDATDKTLTWSSTNTAVAKVDSSGKVTAVGKGSATIVVKRSDGNTVGVCHVEVKVPVPVTGVKITNKKDVTLDCMKASDKYYQCSISVSPSDASNKSVTWSSSDTAIATVDANGKITAKGIGIATITVKTVDGSKTDNIKVYVYKTNAVIPKGGNTWYRVSIGSATNRVMDVYEGNTYDGAKVQLYSTNSSNAQLWQFHDYKSKHGGIAIVPKCNSNGYILNVSRSGGALKENNLINVWTIGKDNATSMWELIRTWDGGYIFRLVNTNWVAGVTSTLSGAQLMLRKFDLFDMNQRWYLEAVNTSSDDRGISNKLNEAKKLYPHGTVKIQWPMGETCHGYARWLSEYVWGTDFSNGHGNGWTLIKATVSDSKISNLRTGDVVRYRSSGNYNHTIFITSISGNTITYTDCNSDGKGTIKWNQTMDKSTLDTLLKKILSTTYGGEANTYGYIAHYGN